MVRAFAVIAETGVLERPMQREQKMRKLAVLLATGFGLGYSPVASGTVGTLLAFPIVWLMFRFLGDHLLGQLVFAALLAGLAVPICDAAEKTFGTKDDGRIVADEYLTFPICMLGLSWGWRLVLIAFLSCRFFDIVKPPPANRLQALHGGLGIVIDDVLASFYSLVANHVVIALLNRYTGWLA